MRLQELVEYLNTFLRVDEIPDYPGALNGLQVENSGTVSRVAAAVDASAATVEAAAARGCDFVLVHHGLFWDGNLPVTGRRYRRVRALLQSDTALYAAHLPLDVHREVGNNAVLCRELGVEVRGSFGRSKHGLEIGLWGELALSREALAARLDDLLGQRVRLIAGGPERVQRVAVVSGAAGDLAREAAEAGMDALVTGEGSHHTYFDAMEEGINLYYGGHYSTETFGVKALARAIEERFGIPWEFVNLPTGL